MRRATGRDDIWGIGLPMSGQAADTWFQFQQFLSAYEADYVTPDGHLVIDDPEIRRRLIKAMIRQVAANTGSVEASIMAHPDRDGAGQGSD